MGIAQDLLDQAFHLATYEDFPSQAALRRAVSTTYYALFHLLIEDAASRWQGSSAARTGFERAFRHAEMRDTSKRFAASGWRDWHGQTHIVPAALRRFAEAFADLQAERHDADYNNSLVWAFGEVEEILVAGFEAFEDWNCVRTDPIAGNYLLAMLLSNPRR